jgi:hypothetical protein
VVAPLIPPPPAANAGEEKCDGDGDERALHCSLFTISYLTGQPLMKLAASPAAALS